MTDLAAEGPLLCDNCGKPMMQHGTLAECYPPRQSGYSNAISSESRRKCCNPVTWRVRPIFAWYDLWVGVFVDKPKRRLYVFPLPCLGVVLSRD